MTENYEAKILESFSKRKMFIIPGSTNGKYGIDGLAAIAMMSSSEEVYKGSVFVFCTKSAKQIKFLLWENGGYWLITRKIYKSTFAWPSTEKNTNAFEAAKAIIRMVLGSNDCNRNAMIETGCKACFC